MSNFNFTPLPTSSPATSAAFNLRFAELDAAIKKNNYGATTAPTANDDSLDGYTIGSRWVDTVNRRIYVAVSVAAGSAVWRETGWSDKVLIGTGGVFSTFSTIGLTIDQRLNSDALFILKSTGIFAHGMTDVADAATFLTAHKISNAGGGVLLTGYTNAMAAFRIRGRATTEDSTRSISSQAYVSVDAQKKSAANVGSPAANTNLFRISSNGTTRIVFDSDGDSHQDGGRTLRAAGGAADDPGVGWTNYDFVDDVKVLNAMAITLAPEDDPLRAQFIDFIESNRGFLEALPGKQLVTFNEDGHHFINMSRLTMLLVGAVRQLATRVKELEYATFKPA